MCDSGRKTSPENEAGQTRTLVTKELLGALKEHLKGKMPQTQLTRRLCATPSVRPHLVNDITFLTLPKPESCMNS